MKISKRESSIKNLLKSLVWTFKEDNVGEMVQELFEKTDWFSLLSAACVNSPTMETASAVSGVVENLLPLPLTVEDREKIIHLAVETCMDFDRFEGAPWSSPEILNSLRASRARLPAGSVKHKRLGSYIMSKSEIA